MSQSTQTTTIPPKKKNPTYTIYKPNNRGNGGAISFSLNREKGAVFIEAANQSGDRQFDWENKIIMKWGLSDLGSVLAGLRGRLPETKLFHKTERANSALNLVSNHEPNQVLFYMSVSRQDLATQDVRKVSISISAAEATIVETALEMGINRILDW